MARCGFKKIIAAIAACFIIAQFFSFLFLPKPAQAYLGILDTNITDSAFFQYVTSFNAYAAKQTGTETANLTKTTLTSIYTSLISKLTNQQFWINAAKELAIQAWLAVRRMMLKMLVNDIVQWIQNGTQPRFITSWSGFLSTAADKALGNFVAQELGQGWLCNAIQPQLIVALRTIPTFDENVRCSLSDMGKNIGNFFKNFTNGGWNNWIQVTESGGNVYGAYLMAADRRIDVMSAAQTAAQNEGLASNGFLGDKVCLKIYENANPQNTGSFYSAPLKANDVPQGWTCAEWSQQTPGSIVADATSQAVNIDIPWLISAKEWREYASAIIDAIVNRVMKEGLALMKSGSNYQDAPAAAPAAADPTSYVNSVTSAATATNVPDQLKLVKDNLNKVLAEYQNNLNYLGQVKSAQTSSFSTVLQLAQAGCALPAGVSQAQVGTRTSGRCDGLTCPCTQTNIVTTRITLPSSGTLDVDTIQTIQYTQNQSICDPTAGYCAPCVAAATVTYQPTTTTAADSEINATNAAMAVTDAQINQIDPLIAKVQNYLDATDAYNAAWNADPSVMKNSASTLAAQQVMDTTKQTAISALQSFLGSNSTNLNSLLQDAQTFSQDLNGKVYDVSSKRGGAFATSCDYAPAGTYFSMLCAAQAQKAALDAAYSACQYNNNVINNTGSAG